MEISSTKLCKINFDSLHVSESLVRLHWQLSGSPLSTRVQNSKRRNFFFHKESTAVCQRWVEGPTYWKCLRNLVLSTLPVFTFNI